MQLTSCKSIAVYQNLTSMIINLCLCTYAPSTFSYSIQIIVATVWHTTSPCHRMPLVRTEGSTLSPGFALEATVAGWTPANEPRKVDSKSPLLGFPRHLNEHQLLVPQTK